MESRGFHVVANMAMEPSWLNGGATDMHVSDVDYVTVLFMFLDLASYLFFVTLLSVWDVEEELRRIKIIQILI